MCVEAARGGGMCVEAARGGGMCVECRKRWGYVCRESPAYMLHASGVKLINKGFKLNGFLRVFRL